MDPQPSTSSQLTTSPRESFSPTKQKSRFAFTVTEKQMICNVYKYVFAEKSKALIIPTESPTQSECVEKTAEILQISNTSIYRVIKENKENDKFKTPKKPGPKLNFKDKLDEMTLSKIRRKVHTFFRNKETPTIKKIHNAVIEDPDLPNLSRSQVWKILKHLNFQYVSKSRKTLEPG